MVIKPPTAYKGNEGRVGYRFFTRNLPDLTVIHDRFYPKGIKIIPRYLNLTPLSLAVWFMDDGSKSYNSVYFNSQKLDSISQFNLMKSLSKLGIKSTLNIDKIYYRIRVRTSSAQQLVNIIMPHIIKSMQYKLPL